MPACNGDRAVTHSPRAEKNAAFFSAQPGMVMSATNGMFAVAASVLGKTAGLCDQHVTSIHIHVYLVGKAYGANAAFLKGRTDIVVHFGVLSGQYANKQVFVCGKKRTANLAGIAAAPRRRS